MQHVKYLDGWRVGELAVKSGGREGSSMSGEQRGFAVRGACIIAVIAMVYLALCADRLRQSRIEQSQYELTDDEQ